MQDIYIKITYGYISYCVETISITSMNTLHSYTFSRAPQSGNIADRHEMDNKQKLILQSQLIASITLTVIMIHKIKIEECAILYTTESSREFDF